MIVVILFVFAAFNRCSQISSLSGKYVNEQDKSEYFKFSGESTVVLHTGGNKVTGTYSIYEDAVMLIFGSGDKAERVILGIKNKNTLIYNGVGVAFVKRTFWNYYWKWYLLWSSIISVIWFLVKKIFVEHKGIKEIISDIDEEVG